MGFAASMISGVVGLSEIEFLAGIVLDADMFVQSQMDLLRRNAPVILMPVFLTARRPEDDSAVTVD